MVISTARALYHSSGYVPPQAPHYIHCSAHQYLDASGLKSLEAWNACTIRVLSTGTSRSRSFNSTHYLTFVQATLLIYSSGFVSVADFHRIAPELVNPNVSGANTTELLRPVSLLRR